MALPKQNKFNSVSSERFDKISKQIQRSIELVTQIHRSFNYSEPIPVNVQLDTNVDSFANLNFEFSEPLYGEEKDVTAELVDLLSLLNLGQSDESSYQLDCSIQSSGRVAGNDGNDNAQISSLQLDSSKEEMVDNDPASDDNIQTSSLQMDCSKKNSYQLDCSLQSSEIVSSNDGNHNAQISSLQLDSSKEEMVGNDPAPKDNIQTFSLQMDSSEKQDVDHNSASNDGNDNTQTDVNKSAHIDPNTQITHLDIDNSKPNPPPPKQPDKQPLLLLIKDVHTITWLNQEESCSVPVMQLFGQTFHTVLVYGIVTSITVENGGLVQRFVIDDGSGSINVVWRANNHMIELIKTLHDLNDEVKLCRQSGLSVMNENWQPDSRECIEMLNSFDQIIFYVKREVTKRTKLKLFGYAAVVGKPVRPPGKGIVQLHSWVVEDDSRGDRSLELYYKKNLIRLYEEKYMHCS